MQYDESAHAENVHAWIDAYLRAWKSNDPADIAVLFTEDATYRTAPFREPRLGHDEIISGWLRDRVHRVVHGAAGVRRLIGYGG